mmetsp:Transcript_14674/g.18444  ORF Transcript_14674/g.18444 Transcript_14674/m.18444 type:complete len:119 (+) Transcript_14674:184-540(+)|eukprot:CAMPEP_0170454922 /NCGR_PEP_ID=MMETSP0123-20130129/3025_1 /TAXON_ID=182087 /ORGANISM="Favella ehrenbergii, Strain Fehren 1" /LENGTH=118 /DNA_ID=CAMNT_0010717821 /DNA_START=169 /DNA_END=525 /DNA_ORIENTATION=-
MTLDNASSEMNNINQLESQEGDPDKSRKKMLNVALYKRRIAKFSQKYGLHLNQFVKKKRREGSSLKSVSLAIHAPSSMSSKLNVRMSQDILVSNKSLSRESTMSPDLAIRNSTLEDAS